MRLHCVLCILICLLCYSLCFTFLSLVFTCQNWNEVISKKSQKKGMQLTFIKHLLILGSMLDGICKLEGI